MTDPQPSAPPDDTLQPVTTEWPWAFAFLTGAFVLAAGVGVQTIAWEGRSFRDALLHVSIPASLVALLSWRAVDAAALRLLGSRGPVVAWRAVTWAALALAACHWYSLGYFLHVGWSFFEWFGRLWELEPEYGAVAAVAFVAAAALARVPVAPRRRLRAEARLATLVACALLALACVRASRRPQVQRKPTGKYVMATTGPRSHGCIGGSRWQPIHPRRPLPSWAAAPTA